jgi:hypothetical protein
MSHAIDREAFVDLVRMVAGPYMEHAVQNGKNFTISARGSCRSVSFENSSGRSGYIGVSLMMIDERLCVTCVGEPWDSDWVHIGDPDLIRKIRRSLEFWL